MVDPDTISQQSSYEYWVGGTLKPNHPTYVERVADQRLYSLLKSGNFCFILNSRQMGKSSLVIHVREKLKSEGFSFAIIDLSAVGAEIKSTDQWYTTILYELQENLDLEDIDLFKWWQQEAYLTPSARLGKFIEIFLLSRYPQKKFIIVIDEIDYVLKLKLKLQNNVIDGPSTDDFFAFIRSCYNQRTSKIEYERLSFVLIGVATPYDLISNPDCTPFNIGQEIKLHGFRSSEVKPLEPGLIPVADRPEIVLQEILYWTGGQPFLTQKLCNLIHRTSKRIESNTEAVEIEALVRTEVIQTWSQKDQPAHLGVIRDRIIKSRRSPSSLLMLYRQILSQGEIQENRESLEQLELKLTGLVVEHEGTLRVYNLIYQSIFNQQWIKQELSKLRPYSEAIGHWVESNYSDGSRLLRGKALQDALRWATDQLVSSEELSEDDRRFLETSQVFEQIATIESESSDILRQELPQLQQITASPTSVIREILAWVGSQPTLIQLLCQQLSAAYVDHPMVSGAEAEEIAAFLQTHWIENWQQQSAADYLKKIQIQLRENDRCVLLLEHYLQILDQENIQDVEESVLSSLQTLGLIEKSKVFSRLIANVFDKVWIEKEIQQAKQRRIICGRFKEIEALKTNHVSQNYHVYLVVDKHLKNKRCLLREYQSSVDQFSVSEETRSKIHKIFRDLEKLKGHDRIPEALNLEDDGKFYVTQEFIDGRTLEKEFSIKDGEKVSKPWIEADVITLLLGILNVLEFVHLQNLAHLNLKPANLLKRQSDDNLILLDFDLFQEINRLLERDDERLPTQGDKSQYAPPATVRMRSSVNSDLYAVGMIGIHAVTGIPPELLKIDPITGEVIWLYDILPHRYRIPINDKLAEILSKLIHHQTDGQYASATEVLKSLENLHQLANASALQPDLGHSKSRHSGLFNKRFLIGCGAALALSGIAIGAVSAWISQRTVVRQQQIEECDYRISLKPNDKSGSQNLITHQVVIDAEQVIQACQQVALRQPQNFQVLQNQGKAYLLLWKHELLLGNSNLAKQNLNKALEQFNRAIDLQPAQPQASFYRGLAQSFRDAASARQSYESAIDSYFTKKASLQADDLPILANLISFLIQENDLTENYDDAEALFDKAYSLSPGLVNLIYNRAALNARAGSYPQALRLFEQTLIAQPNHFEALRGKGFVHLLQGQSDFPQAKAALDQAIRYKPQDVYTKVYLKRINDCISLNGQIDRATCNLRDFSRDIIKPNFDEVFPILPIYPCSEYPILGIAQNGKQNPLCAATLVD